MEKENKTTSFPSDTELLEIAEEVIRAYAEALGELA